MSETDPTQAGISAVQLEDDQTLSSALARVRPPRYDFHDFEAKWRERWEREKIYQVNLYNAERPYYNLMMFPYPSAEGLHVGNMYSYVGSDIHGRWMAMQGYDVFEPMGFDAFGIHSENFAIQRGIHPRILTARNVERFREQQLKRIGNRFDWSHEVQTTDPHYYRWTQWIFVQLFKHGLAERKTAPVNWCPKDKTVLADEQVINGRCERCGTLVERRWLAQWFLKLTNYAQRLLDDLDQLDWSERVKAIQRNWIGRSEGLEFLMEIDGLPDVRVQVYTTRPDTIFGMTFVALAPHHPLIEQITDAAHLADVTAYQQTANRLRTETEQTITGVFTGAYALHPLTGERIPIWVADFVLEGYGAGAVMGVPAHDERDMAFARAVGLPVRVVVVPPHTASAPAVERKQEAYVQPGILIDSDGYSGMTSQQAEDAIAAWFEERGVGRRVAKYRLRTGSLAGSVTGDHRSRSFIVLSMALYRCRKSNCQSFCPMWRTGCRPGRAFHRSQQLRASSTFPVPSAASRADAKRMLATTFWTRPGTFCVTFRMTTTRRPWNPDLIRKWLPVDMYIGGAEHSVLHLMYVRFITMALHDLGYLEFEEPFKRFRANGTITKDGGKISKSKGNVVNPDDYIERFGADVFRVYLMFMGPYEAGGDFSDRGIGGVVRFLDRVWLLVDRNAEMALPATPQGEERRVLHRLIKRVTEDIAALKYNTVVAALMEFLNALEKRKAITAEEIRTLLLLLAPLAPYIAEELWQRLGQPGGYQSIHTASWPTYDEAAIYAETMLLPVQVNGRVRGRIEVAHSTSEAEVKRLALLVPQVQAFIADQPVSRLIYVPGRLVNIVTT